MRIPPTSANGRFIMMSPAYFTEPNAPNSRMKMSTRLVGNPLSAYGGPPTVGIDRGLPRSLQGYAGLVRHLAARVWQRGNGSRYRHPGGAHRRVELVGA